jgi:hypothetical protein
MPAKIYAASQTRNGLLANRYMVPWLVGNLAEKKEPDIVANNIPNVVP